MSLMATTMHGLKHFHPLFDSYHHHQITFRLVEASDRLFLLAYWGLRPELLDYRTFRHYKYIQMWKLHIW